MMSTRQVSSVIARIRRLADRRGTVLVEYSSLVLLIAIAAIAVLTEVPGGGVTN
jgi:Flp pilus assembly pilin Flp